MRMLVCASALMMLTGAAVAQNRDAANTAKRVSEALGSGQKEVDEALPEERQAVSTTTTRSRQKPAKKRLPTKKGAAAR